MENVNGGEILQRMKKIKEFYLIALAVVNCEITEKTLLLPFPNLRFLNLSSNLINVLNSNHFSLLKNLEILILSKNTFEILKSRTFEHLINLREIEIENSIISFFGENLFSKLNKLKKMNLKNSKIFHIFDNFLKNLIFLQNLNLFKSFLNEKNVISKLNFQFNKKLDFVSSNYFTLCCFLKIHRPSAFCRPKENDYFSCENLIGSKLKKGLCNNNFCFEF